MVEICCGSYADALAAWRGGAPRIELNSGLALGGLTPSESMLRLVKQHTGLRVVCMVRPRGAGFCYTETEAEQMYAEAEALLEQGGDGISFGFLTAQHTIDEARTRRMVELIHAKGGEAVFHRAFDCAADLDEAMQVLLRLGVDRVLTSGGQPTAPQGAECLRVLQDAYGDRIELLAGSGVNAGNARALMEQTGVGQVHSSCKAWQTDPTTRGAQVDYSIAPAPHEMDYDIVSEELVRKLVAQVQ